MLEEVLSEKALQGSSTLERVLPQAAAGQAVGALRACTWGVFWEAWEDFLTIAAEEAAQDYFRGSLPRTRDRAETYGLPKKVSGSSLRQSFEKYLQESPGVSCLLRAALREGVDALDLWAQEAWVEHLFTSERLPQEARLFKDVSKAIEAYYGLLPWVRASAVLDFMLVQEAYPEYLPRKLPLDEENLAGAFARALLALEV